MKVGIDKLAFYTPPFYLPLATLAQARGVDADKYHIGLGQQHMAVIPPDESIVTMAANAASTLLQDEDKSSIDHVLFATESGVDQSKAAGIFVHHLLKLPARCRVVELKQACYSATAGLHMAMALLQQNPKRKILLLAADIARYGLGSAGEPSQGGGAVAMLLSANPRVLEIEPECGYYTRDVMDFWRPNYRDEALVEGKYSCEIYLDTLTKAWQHYHEASERGFDDHQQFLYHIPFPRLAEKAHHVLRDYLDLPKAPKAEVSQQLDAALHYSRSTGNCYSGSLYLGLVSLLDNHVDDLNGQRIGLYSYGSGCVGEFYSAVVQPNYQQHIFAEHHQSMLAKRQALTIEQYEQFYQYHSHSAQHESVPHTTTGKYRYAGSKDHKPIFESSGVTARAPGKLILSGEHAVVQGAPCLVVAIDRYTTTTVTAENKPHLRFHLPDIQHVGETTFDKLGKAKNRLQDAYGKFSRGERGIRDVLQKPFELLHYTASHTLEKLDPKRERGFEVSTQSTLPIGCGMGSSASSVVSTNYAITHYLGKAVDSKLQYELSLAAENMQHGQSSGVDLHIAIYGGCHLFQQGQSDARPCPTQPFYIVNTGKPESNTGECVSVTSQHFAQEESLLDAFSDVTYQVDQALQNQDDAALITAVKANHALLVQIGVVPKAIAAFIAAVEHAGGAGKTCGAGAVKGEHAGCVWLLGDKTMLARLAEQHGYTLETLHAEANGVTLV